MIAILIAYAVVDTSDRDRDEFTKLWVDTETTSSPIDVQRAQDANDTDILNLLTLLDWPISGNCSHNENQSFLMLFRSICTFIS